jgi:parvulin-like peptidyl-prolyl isomerase
MLSAMNKLTERHGKLLLVVVAALLMVVFVIQPGQFGGGGERALGTFGGQKVTRSEIESLAARWARLGLQLRLPVDYGVLPGPADDSYLLLLAARQHGIKVGSDAVEKRLHNEPAQTQRIEYVLADPEKLAKGIKPEDAELRARYNKRDEEDKKTSFEDARKSILAEVKLERAKAAAQRKIAQAHALIAAAPTSGAKLRRAFRDAAEKTGLAHERPRYAFSEQNAVYFLSDLAERTGALSMTRTSDLSFPPDFKKALFNIPVGQPSGVMRSGDKLFVFRVIEASAGFSAAGKLMLKDYAWRSGRYMMVQEYGGYKELFRAKINLDPSDAAQAFREYLTVQKYIRLACGGATDSAPITDELRDQLLAYENEEVEALSVSVPVGPFKKKDTPDEARIISFHNSRSRTRQHPDELTFGYLQPETVQIEYVIAPPKHFEELVRDKATTEQARAYYERNKEKKFARADGQGVKDFADVRAEIVRDLRKAEGSNAARSALSGLLKRAETSTGERRPLKGPAQKLGLEYYVSRFFARHEIKQAVGRLAASPDFAEQAFGTNLRPIERERPEGAPIMIHPTSGVLDSNGTQFFFRLVARRERQAREYTELDERQKSGVLSDYRHVQAVQRAFEAARGIRAGIMRDVLGTVAAENKLSVARAMVKVSEPAGAAASVPPALRDHVIKKMKAVPGEVAPLVKDGDAYYTVTTTEIGKTVDETHIEYIRFTPGQFIATVEPAPSAITVRAMEIRKKIDDAKKDDKKKDEVGAELVSPTAKDKAQALAELREEWKAKPFAKRYTEYFQKTLLAAFRSYVAANPLEYDLDVRLGVVTPGYFHADDTTALGGDTALIKAAFALKPGQLSGPVVGDKLAAVMLLDAQTTRKEVRIEMISVTPGQYDALDVVVSEKDAKAYYAAHKDEFVRPAKVQAEYLFASFRKVADSIESTVADEAISTYYELNKTTAYVSRALDAGLKDTIRRLLAMKRAEAEAAKAAITAAIEAVKTASFEQVARATPLDASVTKMLGPSDKTLDTVGYAPSLVQNILAAKKGVLGEPIEVDDGWVLFRVTERTKSVTPSADAALPQARDLVRKQRLDAKARNGLKAIKAELARNKTATIEELIKRVDLASTLPGRPRVETTRFFDQAHALDLPYMTTVLRKAVFAAKKGEVTAIVSGDDKVQLARVIDAKTNRLVRVHIVPVGAELFAGKIKVSEAEAKAHYEAHKDDYKRAARYETEYLLANTWSLESDIKPSDAEVEAAYEQLKHRFAAKSDTSPAYKPLSDVRAEVTSLVRSNQAVKKAEELAKKAKALLAKGKSLKDVAAELKGVQHVESETYELGDENTPWTFRRVAGLEAFLKTAKVGDVSPALRAFSGQLLVRVKAVHPAGAPAFDKIKERVENDVATERGLADAKALVAKVISRIENPTVPTAETMRRAAEQFNVTRRMKERLRAADVKYHTRRQPPAQFGRAMSPRLFAMASGVISEPPIIDGEKSQVCHLAVLTGRRQSKSPYAEMWARQFGSEVARQRQMRLLVNVWTQFKPTPREQ